MGSGTRPFLSDRDDSDNDSQLSWERGYHDTEIGADYSETHNPDHVCLGSELSGPEGPSAPSQTPEGPSAPSQTPEGPSAPSQTPQGPSVPSQTPQGPSAPSQTPEGPSAPSQTLQGPSAPSQTLQGPSAPSQTPEGASSPSQTPEGPSAPSQTPEGPSAPSQTPEILLIHSQAKAGPPAMGQAPGNIELRRSIRQRRPPNRLSLEHHAETLGSEQCRYCQKIARGRQSWETQKKKQALRIPRDFRVCNSCDIRLH
ncbi:UNVERIFIED_CONTAM: hypothetical protein FKN15_055847 [Acipenser sinensis]